MSSKSSKDSTVEEVASVPSVEAEPSDKSPNAASDCLGLVGQAPIEEKPPAEAEATERRPTILDNHQQGPTAKVIAQCTIWTDCTIKWGDAEDGLDHVGIKVTLQPFFEKGKKKVRIGFFFNNNKIPLWWTYKQREAMATEMRSKTWELKLAAKVKQHSIIEGHDWEQPSGIVGKV